MPRFYRENPASSRTLVSFDASSRHLHCTHTLQPAAQELISVQRISKHFGHLSALS
jgi:hypothetical protein